jgi:hypothetical protein
LRQSGAFAALLQQAGRPPWVVYAKRPFAGPQQVLAYLSRYTHRVAIGNRRLLQVNERAVSFRYKDYAQPSQPKTMTLSLQEFVRRFGLHVLPERFVKIRHCGLVSNRDRQARLARARQALQVTAALTPPSQNADPKATSVQTQPRCPFCGALALILVAVVAPVRPGSFDDSS